jgi:outer membrane protein TolC
MLNRIIFATAILLLPWNGMSQPLADLERLAYEQNPLLKAMMLEYEAALEKTEQVSVWSGPQVSAAIPILPVETRLGAQRLKISASQMFPWFGLTDARKEVFVSMSKERYEEAMAEKLEIAYAIRAAYFRLYEIKQKKAILDKNLELFGSLERIALAKVESGKTNLSDVLRIQLKSEELLSHKSVLENKRSMFEAEINRLAGREAGSAIIVTDSFELAVVTVDREDLMEAVADQHPQLKRMDWMIKASLDRIEANSISGKPSFGFGVEYALVSPRDDAAPSGNGRDILVPKISASIPLQRKQYNARNREEHLLQLAISERKTGMIDQFEAQLEIILAEYREILLNADLIRRQQELAGSAIEILLSAYSAEGKNFDELLQLENELLNLDIRWVETITASQIIQARIDRIKG